MSEQSRTQTSPPEPSGGEGAAEATRRPDQATSRDGKLVRIAHDRMRAAILNGELPAGLVISQVDLAKRLDVGRTPLREAVRTLQEEGLIFPQARRIRIAEFSTEDIEEVYVLRLLLETAAIGMTVPQLTPEEVAELWGLLAQMSHFAAQHDFERVETPHRSFHTMLVGKSGERILRQIEQLSDHAERYRRAYLALQESSFEISTAEHHGLYEAAAAGDAPEAVRRLAAHYLRTATSVIAQLDESYVPERLLVANAMANGHAEIFSVTSS
jgi:DNA-binding GntR family transcriptional regulator